MTIVYYHVSILYVSQYRQCSTFCTLAGVLPSTPVGGTKVFYHRTHILRCMPSGTPPRLTTCLVSSLWAYFLVVLDAPDRRHGQPEVGVRT